MDLELTVLSGGRVTWQGAPVEVPSADRSSLATLQVGTVVRASCFYRAGRLDVEQVMEVVHRPQTAEQTLTSLGTRGLFREVLAATHHASDPTGLAFQGRALVALGQVKEGFAALEASLELGGPACELEAWHSPWLAWVECTGTQKLSLVSRRLLTAVTRWSWAAASRSASPGALLHPALHGLLAARPIEMRRPAPWHAGGAAPLGFEGRVFARQALRWLSGRLVDPSFERERLIAEAALAGRELRTLLGPVADPLKQAVQLVARAVASGEPVIAPFARVFESGAAGEALLPLARAIDVAEFASVVDDPALVQRVEQVVFRGLISVRLKPVVIIAALTGGGFVTVLQRRGVQLTEGTREDAIAAVPEIHFELAVEALTGFGGP
jgi:hypothetical protein